MIFKKLLSHNKKVKGKKIKNSPQHQRLIRNRIGLIFFLTLLIVALLTFDFYNRELQNWQTIDKNLNIFLLINLNIILLITVALLLVRNLIKLLYERKKRLLGFRLKGKLTVAFVMISTLPMIVFFLIANQFITNSLNFWFKGQYSLVLKNAAVVVKNFSQHWDEDLNHYSNIVAADILREKIEVAKEPSDWFNRKLHRFRLDGIVIYDANLKPAYRYFSSPEKGKLWVAIDTAEFNKGIEDSNLRFDRGVENGHIHRALVPIKLKDSSLYLEVDRITSGAWNSDLEMVRQRLTDYENLLLLENPIRTNYTAYLLLFTLLIIFACTWFGYYMARTITVPIETLVDGTHRIVKGDVDFQIDLQADDEIGMLLNSFNVMTKELQQNRAKLARNEEALIKTNRELQERNGFVELVLKNVQMGVFSIDNSGYVNTINPYMCNLFQLNQPQEKLMWKHYRTVLSKELIKHFEELRSELTKKESKSLTRTVHLRINKRSFHISLQLFPLSDVDGDPLGQLLVIDDMTELDRSTRARAWREVARRIAHEIKNPLTPIQLSTQRIRRKYLEEIDDVKLLDKCTATIIKEVDGLKNMVNEFSKFARLPEINPAPLNINRILKDVYSLFKPGLSENTLLEINLDKSIPNSMLDEEQMKRVFTNLIDNAIAAIDDDGKIILSSSYSKELKIITIKVIDNGCGIPASMAYRIFDPYVTSKEDGTGLGLAIVQQIISDHGGFIRLDNGNQEEVAGTTFTIELPT